MMPRPTKEQQARIDRGNELGRKYQELSDKRSKLLHEYDKTTIEMHAVFTEMNAIGEELYPGRFTKNIKTIEEIDNDLKTSR
jgi:hypothetical protein